MEVVEIGLSGIKWFKWIFITGSPRIHIISDGVASDLLEIHFKMHLILCQHSNVPHANKEMEHISSITDVFFENYL